MTDELRRQRALATTEDDLLLAVTDALTFLGWRWTHARRSDLAQLQGHSGVPDLIAARHGHVIALELKSQTGTLTGDQVAWLESWAPGGAPWIVPDLETQRAAIVRPADLDLLLELLR